MPVCEGLCLMLNTSRDAGVVHVLLAISSLLMTSTRSTSLRPRFLVGPSQLGPPLDFPRDGASRYHRNPALFISSAWSFPAARRVSRHTRSRPLVSTGSDDPDFARRASENAALATICTWRSSPGLFESRVRVVPREETDGRERPSARGAARVPSTREHEPLGVDVDRAHTRWARGG